MNFEIVNYHDLMSWYSDAADDAAQDLAFAFIGQMVRDGDDTTVPTIKYIAQAEKFYGLGLGFFTISDEQKLGRCVKAWKRAYEAYYAPDDGTDEEAPESPEEATANRADSWDEFISAYMEAEKYYAECAKNMFKDFITKPELGGDEVMAAIAARRYFDQALLAADVYSALMHADQVHVNKAHLFMNRVINFMADRARRCDAQVLEWYKEFKKGGDSNTINHKEHQFSPSFVAIESILSISTSNPGVAGDINPFAQVLEWYKEFKKADAK